MLYVKVNNKLIYHDDNVNIIDEDWTKTIKLCGIIIYKKCIKVDNITNKQSGIGFKNNK